MSEKRHRPKQATLMIREKRRGDVGLHIATEYLIKSINKTDEALKELNECLVLFLENLEEVSR